MAINTLYDFYTSQGKALPSVQERQSVASQAGISGYTGTAEQNTTLLSYLQKPAGNPQLPVTTPPTNAANVNTVGSVNIPTPTYASGNTSGVDATTAQYNAQIAAHDKYQADSAAYKAQQEAQKNSPEAKAASSFLDKIIGTKPPSEVRADAQTSTGIDPKAYFAEEKGKIAELDSLNKEYNAVVQARDEQKAALLGQGRGLTNDFLNNQSAQIDRNAAPKLNAMSANINSKAAVLQASQGMFAEASKFVEQAVQDATADLKFNADMYKTFYDTNQRVIDNLDTKYQAAYKASMDAADKAYTTAVANKKAVGELMINNPHANIAITDSLDQAYTKAQSNPGNPIDNAYKIAQTKSLEANTQKTINETNNPGGTPPVGYNGEFQATIDLIANTGSTKDQRASISNLMKTLIANGDYASAYAAIQQQTASSLKGLASTKFSQQTNSLGVLTNLQKQLQALSSAGYNTNLLTGTTDQIQTKIGVLLTNPKYAAIATSLTAAFQNYRQQMTGAAFGEKESADYASILPSPGNTLALNLEKINGAKSYLDSSVNATIKGQFGQGAVNIKDRATVPAVQAPVVKSNGIDLSTFFK